MSLPLSKLKAAAFKVIENGQKKVSFFDIFAHISEVEKWAKWILEKYPKADEYVLLSSVYWHDVGQYVGGDSDHAVNSAKAVRVYLKDKDLDESRKEAIIHCVRAHRCRDVQPESLEAKLLAWCDSASHFTSNVYYLMTKDDLNNNIKEDDLRAIGKIDRDWRDLDLFPRERVVLESLYLSWKKLIREYVRVARERRSCS